MSTDSSLGNDDTNLTTISPIEVLKKPDSNPEKILSQYRSLILSECGFKLSTTENYLKRLQNLRKELSYLAETDWMYPSVDKKPLP